MTYKYLHLWDCKCALLVNRACFYIDFTLQVGEPLMGSTNKLSAIHLLMHKDKGYTYITSAKGWMGSECGHFCWCSVMAIQGVEFSCGGYNFRKIFAYSEVPNWRADRNKQAGLEKIATLLAYLLSKLINEQGWIFRLLH